MTVPSLVDTGAAARLCRQIEYSFTDTDLLELALTHRSRGSRNNERLEFLGDAVLGYVVADALYRQHARLSESSLTLARAELVRKETLAMIGRELNLGDAMRLGEGAARSGGHRRDSILADTVEAVIGAVYLDGGEAQARALVLRLLGPRLKAVAARSGSTMKDAKTLLQEHLQARGEARPEYQLTGTRGKDHSLHFAVLCRVAGAADHPGLEIVAEARSRRAAEKSAAAAVLRALQAGSKGHD